MAVKTLWSSRDWAEAIAALPAPGPLPCRTVLVPRERVAHSLRRELVRAGHADALAGTRFVPVPTVAVAVLRAAGVDFKPGEEELRPARLLVLFGGDLSLEHFSAGLLQGKPGWDDAFARAITDLEAAGLRPHELETEGSARLRDVARIWRSTDRLAGPSWTVQRILLEAAKLLERQPDLWRYRGPVLVTATGHESGAQARFLRAIPGVTIGLLAARPLRERHFDRVEALYGRQARLALAAPVPRVGASERDVLTSYLFEPPQVLADPMRPRSSGPDGTVIIEEHAGIEAEVEATADWVAEQVADGVPLEEMAVLMPALDPVGALVAERLVRLPWREGLLPVHVAGGLPLAGSAGGARALAVVRALRAHLAGHAVAQVLPALRTVGQDGRHLTHGAATDLVWSLGTVGGNPAHPDGALDWASRLAAREPQLEAQLARARAASDDPERSGLARTARDLERLLDDLRSARPALEALVRVARLVVQRASLADLWPALRGFFAEWLLQPGQGPRVQTLLDERLVAAAGDGSCGSLTGDDALRVVEEALASVRLPIGRFGDPAVYVGTLRGATGLRFAAVRVIGLAEGHLPPLTREDPVVPDSLRARLGAPGVGGLVITPPTAEADALQALHTLDIIVRDTTHRITLSAPRLDLDRSQREPSSVILEAAAALGRPNAVTRERGPAIPDTTALRRDAFVPARHAALSFRCMTPLAETAWQDAVARGVVAAPPRWRGSLVVDVERIATLSNPVRFAALDGLLGAAASEVAVPGLAADWPTSPSAIQVLLQCPYLFLLGNLLGLDEPAQAPALREIGQPAYGSLFHSVAEEVFRAHGEGFCAGEGTLEGSLAAADTIVDRLFDEFLEQYPLLGDTVRRVERERLRADIHDLLRYEWGLGPRRFIAAERAFGEPVPVELRLAGRSLFVRGKIDRIDADDRWTFVRDLKTGRVYPRVGEDAEPNPVGDMQIAVYGLAAQRLAPAWGTPVRVGVAYVGLAGDERSFVNDFDATLAPAARQWLAIAADLLAARSFPRTVDPDDCTYCRFRPVCGERVYKRAADILAGGGGALAEFLALKQVKTEED